MPGADFVPFCDFFAVEPLVSQFSALLAGFFSAVANEKIGVVLSV